MHIFGGCILVIGVIALIVGIAFTVFDAQEARVCSAKAPGRVMGVKKASKSSYVPIVQFDGRKSSPRQGSNPPKYKPGQMVTVCYDPKDPSHIRLAEKSLMQVLGWSFAGAGLVLGIVGGLILGFL